MNSNLKFRYMKKCKSKNNRNKAYNKTNGAKDNTQDNSNDSSTITDEEKNQLIKQIGIANLSEFGMA